MAIQTAEHDLDLHPTSTGTAKRDDRWQLKSQEGRSRLLFNVILCGNCHHPSWLAALRVTAIRVPALHAAVSSVSRVWPYTQQQLQSSVLIGSNY